MGARATAEDGKESMDSDRRNEEGFVLAAAVLALVVVGALVTGGFYAAHQESRIGYSSQFAADAFLAAERGLNEVIGTWTLTDFASLAVDEVVTMEDTVVSGGVASTHTVRVRSLGNNLYFVESTGRVIGGGRLGGAARRTGMVVRTTLLDFDSDQALMTYGGVDIKGAAKVDGTNHAPGGWDDCEDTGDRAGIVTVDTTGIEYGNAASLVGDPPIEQDTTLTPEDFFNYGGLSYDQLASLADPSKVFDITDDDVVLNSHAADTTAAGTCDKTQGTNWGAPEAAEGHPCKFYFPVIHAKSDDGSGSLTLNSNASGQGILLVDGDLHISGGFEFYGIVVVKGKLITGGGTSQIHGTTMVFTGGDLGDESTWSGTPTIEFSSCAVKRAVMYNDATSRAFPLGERSWVDLTATGAVTY